VGTQLLKTSKFRSVSLNMKLIKCRNELFQLFYYLRVYPSTSQCGFLFGNRTGYSDILNKFQSQMDFLISKTRFVDNWYHQRFAPENMLPHFFSVFTNGSVDTVPVETRKPVNSSFRSSIYTGKSKRCCLKWQVLCDNLGHIIHVRGPFSSLDYDGHIWDRTYKSLGLWDGRDASNPEHDSRYEVFIGDNHYMNASQCAVPIKKDSGSQLDPLELEYNNFLGSVRSTIEQVFGYLKSWAIIGGVYRGMLLHDVGYRFLSSAFLLCCELYNARFSILGHNKRDIRVIGRDSSGVPLFPPQNLTPENYRLRLNLHHQLSTRKIIFSDFYRADDVVSGSTSLTFKRNDPVWLFMENEQDFIKANVTGVVNFLYSCRSSCKKFMFHNVSPNVIFPRSVTEPVKPVVSLYVVPALPPLVSQNLPVNPLVSPVFPSILDTGSDFQNEFEEDYTNVLQMDNDFLEECDELVDEADQHPVCLPVQPSIEPFVPVDVSLPLSSFLSCLSPNDRICFSPSEDLEIKQVHAMSLRAGHWLKDDVINFFIDNAGDYEDTDTTFYIAYTYYFVSLFGVTSHGEITKYSFPSVKRIFVRRRIKVWEKQKICFPVNINGNHWICIVVDIEHQKIEIVDSLPTYLSENLCMFLHKNMHQWLDDQLQHSLECISAPNNFLYIDDHVERESTNLQIRRLQKTVSKFTYSKVCIWEQQNSYDCGVYCLLACLVYAFNIPIEPLLHLSNPESCNRVREILLNFFRFKYSVKTEENFNPLFFLELIKNRK
jgi:hypothetical protein